MLLMEEKEAIIFPLSFPVNLQEDHSFSAQDEERHSALFSEMVS